MLYDFAIELAKFAYSQDEVPVGAVIFRNETMEVVASGYNQMKMMKSSIAHAEMLAIQSAMSRLKNERLLDCSIITTLEPCPMCAQAISYARLSDLYYSAEDQKSGGVMHGPRIYESSSCHHKPQVNRFDDLGESKNLLQKFFLNKRRKVQI